MKLFIPFDLSLFASRSLYLFTSFFLLMALGFPDVSGQVINWNYEEITRDIYQSGSRPDLYVDGQGNFHVSYWRSNDDKLGYAYRNQATGAWTVESVPDPGLCGYASAVIAESDGTVHIVYHSDLAGNVVLKHATKPSTGNWSISTLIDSSYLGLYGADLQYPTHMQHSLDLYFTPDQKVGLSYFNADYGLVLTCSGVGFTYFNYQMDLEGAILDQGNWTAVAYENIPYQGPFPTCLNRGDRFGEFVTLLNGPGGETYGLANSMHNNELVFYKGTDENPALWDRFSLDQLGNYLSDPEFYEGFGFIDARIGANGFIHATYHTTELYGATGLATSRQKLVYARFHPDSMGKPDYEPFRYAFPGQTEPRYYATISPKDSNNISLTYFQRNSGDVIIQDTDDGGLTWSDPDTLYQDVTVNSMMRSSIIGDSLHLLLYDTRSDQIKMASRYLKDIPAIWRYSAATLSQAQGELTSSVVERNSGEDQVWVAYYDGLSGGVQLSERSGATWTTSTVLPEVKIGAMELQKRENGELLIVHTEASTNQLKLARRQGSVWGLTDIPSTGQATAISTAIEGNDLHLCYYDPINQALRYSHLDGSGSWQHAWVDSSSTFVGRQPSLKVDSLGGIHIGYYDPGNAQLKYAYRPAGGNWDTESLVLDGSVEAASLELALKSDLTPLIAYKNNVVDSIFLAERISGTWQTASMKGTQSATSGRPLRMLIDDLDRPWILYNFPTAINELRLVRRNVAGEWRQVSVLSNGAGIAGEFDFHRLEKDFYIIGRQNQPEETGVGLLYSPNGVQTNVAAPAESIGLSIAPNPTSGQLSVEWQQYSVQPVTIRLYNLTGQQVLLVEEKAPRNPGIQVQQLDLGELPDGLYLMQMQLGTEVYQSRVLKN